MKLFCKTSVLLFALQVISTNTTQECPEGQYVIVDENGKKLKCLLCQDCPVGSGLKPPCGTRILPTANIECHRCDPGTYSEDHGPSLCKSCHICSITLKNCTPESDTKCSKNCDKGYYYDNFTYDCQPCSQCCRKDNKKVAECKTDGWPLISQCSVHDALECSPKTTKNPNNGDLHEKSPNTVYIVIGVLIGVVVVVVLVCLFLAIKHRRQRPIHNNSLEEMRFENNCNCGINTRSFSITVQSNNPNQKVQEYDEVQLICESSSEFQDDNCRYIYPNQKVQEYDEVQLICESSSEFQDDNCRYIYEWKKYPIDYCNQHGTSTFKLHQVLVKNFGIYECKISCSQHHDRDSIKTAGLYLDVLPGPSKRYKYFKEIDSYPLYKKIADMLKSPPTGIGDWKSVAAKYKMKNQEIQLLKESDDRAFDVINYINSRFTTLTVYDFCKFMREIKQNQIVDVLENHLTCENEGVNVQAKNIASTNYAVNGFGKNNIGLNSRQVSKDELAGENPEKAYTLDRQVSNKSQKSSGSGSDSASSSLVRTAKGFVRQISQNQSYKKQENEPP